METRQAKRRRSSMKQAERSPPHKQLRRKRVSFAETIECRQLDAETKEMHPFATTMTIRDNMSPNSKKMQQDDEAAERLTLRSPPSETVGDADDAMILSCNESPPTTGVSAFNTTMIVDDSMELTGDLPTAENMEITGEELVDEGNLAEPAEMEFTGDVASLNAGAAKAANSPMATAVQANSPISGAAANSFNACSVEAKSACFLGATNGVLLQPPVDLSHIADEGESTLLLSPAPGNSRIEANGSMGSDEIQSTPKRADGSFYTSDHVSRKSITGASSPLSCVARSTSTSYVIVERFATENLSVSAALLPPPSQHSIETTPKAIVRDQSFASGSVVQDNTSPLVASRTEAPETGGPTSPTLRDHSTSMDLTDDIVEVEEKTVVETSTVGAAEQTRLLEDMSQSLRHIDMSHSEAPSFTKGTPSTNPATDDSAILAVTNPAEVSIIEDRPKSRHDLTPSNEPVSKKRRRTHAESMQASGTLIEADQSPDTVSVELATMQPRESLQMETARIMALQEAEDMEHKTLQEDLDRRRAEAMKQKKEENLKRCLAWRERRGIPPPNP